MIVDLGSSLGTQVNGQMIAKKVLQPGDHIIFGKMSAYFRGALLRPSCSFSHLH